MVVFFSGHGRKEPNNPKMGLSHKMVTKVVFKAVEVGGKYALADHLEDRFRKADIAEVQPDKKTEDLSTAQVPPPNNRLVH